MTIHAIQHVSHETRSLLEAYYELIKKWNTHINLIDAKTLKDFSNRHLADSLQLMKWIPDTSLTILDMGSGGGLPAIPLLIAGCKDVTMLESDARKAIFLEEAIRVLSLPGKIINQRIEQLKTPFDIITARAFAPLSKLLTYFMNVSHETTYGLFLKGENYEREIEEAKTYFHFKLDIMQSETNERGRILKIEGVKQKALKSDKERIYNSSYTT